MPLPDGKSARIMVIAAHPVDAFDSSGGTCAEHVEQGDQVTVVICTSGINTHNERLLDVTKHYKAKVRAHQYIATQGQHIGWGQKRLEGIEGHCGIFAGTSYAEAFVRVGVPVHETLPISQRRYDDLKLSSAERFRKDHLLLGAFVRDADGSFAWGVDPDKV